MIRGFAKLTGKSFRDMKRAYEKMKPDQRGEANRQLRRFWDQNEAQGLLDHKKYYDLKKPLKQSLKSEEEGNPL